MAEYNLTIEQLLERRGTKHRVMARVEAAKRMRATTKMSGPQIARALQRDPSTIAFYLGGLKAKKPPQLKWRKPHIKFLGWYAKIKPEQRKQPPKPVASYLTPYCGASAADDYTWKERP